MAATDQKWSTFDYPIDFKFSGIIISKLNSKSGKMGEKLLRY